MPVVTLPDGSQRQFDHPVTVDEVAANIGPGLRKAALAGRVDDDAGRTLGASRRGPLEVVVLTDAAAGRTQAAIERAVATHLDDVAIHEAPSR